ncbi:MAG: hypothetical protein EOP51_13225 [Sphingobacteriales bacterium]|nr:MAG: hypothetical protein EOP51_13225 [Sphingobacteriales bacterium]
MKKIGSVIAITLFTLNANAQQLEGVTLKTGDLLFQNLDCGPLCDAIESVTEGFDGHDFSHNGLVYIKADSVYILEAMGKEVKMTPLASFAARSKHKLYVGRLKPNYQPMIAKAIAFSLQNLHVPYDEVYLYDNGKYYCSELIYDAFKYANGGHPFFKLEPMTFKTAGKDEFNPAWVEYYKELNVPIPEGKPGINPGGMSRSEKLVILNK